MLMASHTSSTTDVDYNFTLEEIRSQLLTLGVNDVSNSDLQCLKRKIDQIIDRERQQSKISSHSERPHSSGSVCLDSSSEGHSVSSCVNSSSTGTESADVGCVSATWRSSQPIRSLSNANNSRSISSFGSPVSPFVPDRQPSYHLAHIRQSDVREEFVHVSSGSTDLEEHPSSYSSNGASSVLSTTDITPEHPYNSASGSAKRLIAKGNPTFGIPHRRSRPSNKRKMRVISYRPLCDASRDVSEPHASASRPDESTRHRRKNTFRRSTPKNQFISDASRAPTDNLRFPSRQLKLTLPANHAPTDFDNSFSYSETDGTSELHRTSYRARVPHVAKSDNLPHGAGYQLTKNGYPRRTVGLVNNVVASNHSVERVYPHSDQSSIRSRSFYGQQSQKPRTVHNAATTGRSARFAPDPVSHVHDVQSVQFNTDDRVLKKWSYSSSVSRPLSSSSQSRRHDPVTRYRAYRQSWSKNFVPGEDARRLLRWNIKTAMMHREVPLLQRNFAEVSQLLGRDAAAIVERARQRNLKALQLGPIPTKYRPRVSRQTHFSPRDRGTVTP